MRVWVRVLVRVCGGRSGAGVCCLGTGGRGRMNELVARKAKYQVRSHLFGPWSFAFRAATFSANAIVLGLPPRLRLPPLDGARDPVEVMLSMLTYERRRRGKSTVCNRAPAA